MFIWESGMVREKIILQIYSKNSLGTKVALKKLNNEEQFDEFSKEAGTLRYFHKIKILKFLIKVKSYILIVFNFLEFLLLKIMKK